LGTDSLGALRVVVVDSSELIRAGLRAMLAPHGIAIVGEAADPDRAVEVVEKLAPAVVTTELHLSSGSGIEATRRLSVAAPSTPVMVLTASTEKEDLTAAVAAGARGYMVKDARMEAIAGAMRAVAAGQSVISSRVADYLFHGVRVGSINGAPYRAASEENGTLTERETEILQLLACGKENSEIARLLHLSPSTVKNHISSILHKLAVENRIQAAVLAVRSGVV